MQIGLFSDSYCPTVNGVTNHISYLKRGLKRVGHTVHLFCPADPEYKDQEENVHRVPTIGSSKLIIDRILGVEIGGRISLPLPGQYMEIISKLDLIHSHHIFILGAYARHYAGRHDIPLFLTNHTHFEEVPPFDESKILLTAIRHLVREYAADCAGVISPGKGMKDCLVEYYRIETPIHVIPNGVDLQRFRKPITPSVDELKNHLGLRQSDQVLLYVGRLSKEKNLRFLLQAVSSILRQNSSVRLLIVGGGILQDDLMDATSEMSVKGQVTFTGYVPPDKVNEYYALGDIFVTASKSEVFPLTVIEALAAPMPVVAIDAVGTRDTVDDGVTGILTQDSVVAFRTAIENLLNNPTLREEMQRNALQSVGKWAADESVRHHLALFEQFATVSGN
jgi:glycosyltransferase involved in cell wall biosynthesis